MTPDLKIIIQSKIPVLNLFWMLEYVYNLKKIRFLDSLINCESLQEFYNFFAHLLAQTILDRPRQRNTLKLSDNS